MSKAQSILLVTPGFPRDEDDTTCIPALQELVTGLRKHAPSITLKVIALHYPGTSKTYHWHGIEVCAIGADNCSYPKRLVYWKKLQKKVKGWHEKYCFDLIHTFWYGELNIVLERFSKQVNVPLYCTFMGQDALPDNKYAGRINIPEERLISLSAFHQQNIKEHLGLTPKTIIPWGMNKVAFASQEKNIDIINIGWFNDIKRQDQALAIMKELIFQDPSLQCVFVGDGPHLPKLKTAVDQDGLSDNILFMGHLDRPSTLMILGKSKLLLHTSDYESYGMIFPEAVAAKTMIVSKAVGIAREEAWWKLYSTEEEAIHFIHDFLSSEVYPSDNDQLIFSVEKTVAAYLNFWA
jgi:glycosyltransferase involved in cell wall biosynthesis